MSHQVHKVQGENVDTAGHSGQSTDDGGENTETTSAEQKVLPRNVFRQITILQPIGIYLHE